jgi:hypothetical protein
MSQLASSRPEDSRPPWWLPLVFTLVLLTTLLFAVRVARHVRSGGPAADVRAWMNIPHIARTHRVPVALLNQAVGLPPDAFDRRPLMELARDQGRPVEELVGAVKAAVVQARQPPDPPPLPDRPPPATRELAP